MLLLFPTERDRRVAFSFTRHEVLCCSFNVGLIDRIWKTKFQESSQKKLRGNVKEYLQ
uniref:Uncharacterized protein n=1 Tax=Octopus bimaculoides TaxID=37653 RepID=A0A0L8IF95_OCTBM